MLSNELLGPSSQNASGYRSRSHDAKPGMPMVNSYLGFVQILLIWTFCQLSTMKKSNAAMHSREGFLFSKRCALYINKGEDEVKKVHINLFYQLFHTL
jgi:hypothetical protein